MIPVWNKSNREHTIIGSDPSETRAAADQAVASEGWKHPYFVDADHINLKTVDRFFTPCDFFTLDVADCIGHVADDAVIESFMDRHDELVGTLRVPGIDRPLPLTRNDILQTLRKYLAAVGEAGRIYEYIAARKGAARFVAEVSMDETDAPQTPPELLVILVALADLRVPVQTVAPKFTGRFNKGVDYRGDLIQFAREFSEDIAVIAYAVANYGLPKNLKLSVHSGSDKFSIFAPMHKILQDTGAGLHLKTAGTTWLEELVGLAEHGGEGLETAKEIYAAAFAKREELSAPYSSVIDINVRALPQLCEVNGWTAEQFVAALRHNPQRAGFNPSLRQLLHIGFKIAAQMGPRYVSLLKSAEAVIAKNVTENLFERHIKPLFIGA